MGQPVKSGYNSHYVITTKDGILFRGTQENVRLCDGMPRALRTPLHLRRPPHVFQDAHLKTPTLPKTPTSRVEVGVLAPSVY